MVEWFTPLNLRDILETFKAERRSNGTALALILRRVIVYQALMIDMS